MSAIKLFKVSRGIVVICIVIFFDYNDGKNNLVSAIIYSKVSESSVENIDLHFSKEYNFKTNNIEI